MEDKYLADCIISDKRTSEAILLDLLERNKMDVNILYDISKSPNLSPKVLSMLVKILVNEEYFAYNMHEYTNILIDLLEEHELSQKNKQMILELTKKSTFFANQHQDSDYKYAFPYYRETLLDALKEDHEKQ